MASKTKKAQSKSEHKRVAAQKKIERPPEKIVDSPAPSAVTSLESPVSEPPAEQPATPAPATAPQTSGEQKMAELTFTRSDKERKSISVVYTTDGYPGSVRFSKTLFKDKQAPASIVVNSDAFATKRVAETKEERKARLKAMPKLTDAQKLQKIEEKAARLRAKLSKGGATSAAA